jgi:hypothetical protein
VIYDTKLYIGASTAGGLSGWNEGEVYVYDLEARSLLTTLYSPMPRYYGLFGSSLAVTDGYIIVGAEREDDWQSGTGLTKQGLVHIFNSTSYEAVAMIKSPNPTADGYFGEAVATDGTYLVIGASGEGTPEDSGKAYLYSLSDISATPIVLISANPEVGGCFGEERSVAISEGTIVIGAQNEVVSEYYEYDDAGHVYIFSVTP